MWNLKRFHSVDFGKLFIFEIYTNFLQDGGHFVFVAICGGSSHILTGLVCHAVLIRYIISAFMLNISYRIHKQKYFGNRKRGMVNGHYCLSEWHNFACILNFELPCYAVIISVFGNIAKRIIPNMIQSFETKNICINFLWCIHDECRCDRFQQSFQGLLLLTWINPNGWINNLMLNRTWHEITYPFPNLHR